MHTATLGASAAAHGCDEGVSNCLVGALWTLISPASGWCSPPMLIATVLLTSPRLASDLTGVHGAASKRATLLRPVAWQRRALVTASENVQREVRGSWAGHGVPLFDPLRRLPIAWWPPLGQTGLIMRERRSANLTPPEQAGRTARRRLSRPRRPTVDEMGEWSFPASDPPATWTWDPVQGVDNG